MGFTENSILQIVIIIHGKSSFSYNGRRKLGETPFSVTLIPLNLI